jgi:hypothetical protein
MSNDKLCEYLTDIGILLFDNIELFFKINSIKSDNNFNNEPEKLKNSLFQYMQKTSKDDNLLHTMSKQIIDSYYNVQAVTQYKALKNFINIYQNKLFLIYNNFFINLSLYIINKSKSTKNKEDKNKDKDKNKIKRTHSDENILKDSQEGQDLTIRKKAKTKSKPKKKVQTRKRTNQYRNNYYRNIQENNTNPHSFFVNTNINDNYNYMGAYRNDYQKPNKKITDVSNDNYSRDIYDDDNIISYKYYSPMVNIQSKTPINNINNNMPMNNYQNNYNPQMPTYMNNNNINNLGFNQEMEEMNNNNYGQIYNNNNNADMFFDAEDDYDFFDNEKKHLQRVHNKIMNLKNEKISKIDEQCTFAPKININPKYLKNENNNNSNNNVFTKLYNESSQLKKKNQERIKKTIDSYKFTPDIEGNEKYQVKLPFYKRLKKSIDKKGQFINDKLKEEKKKMEEELVNKNVKVDVNEVLKRIYYKPMEEMKKEKENAKKKEEKPVIDWKKRYNYYNSKENDYKKQLEKRRKFLNSVSINNNNNGNNGNIIDFNQFMNEVEKDKEKTNNNNNNTSDNINNNTNNNNDEDDKNNNNLGEDNNEENRKENSPEGVQDAINEAYKSSSLQQLLNANNN